MIWGGDELGMWGADDPECRKPLLWPDLMPFDNPDDVPDFQMLAHVQALANIRRDFPALRRGHLRPALLDDEQNVYAFERRLHTEPSSDDIFVALHRGEGDVTISLPVHWPDGTEVFEVLSRWLDPSAPPTIHTVEDGVIELTLGPDEGAIFAVIP